ncbi:MAG: hypothetical protein COA66_08985 [Arcobacter sp.]|nr:MAG: hypothetical protein COA66_08985 [Arcobacter sp.]
MIDILLGLVLVYLSADFKRFSMFIKQAQLFNNKKYLYSITFVLNFIGYTLLFDAYGFWIAIMNLVIIITYNKFIKKNNSEFHN